MTDRRPRLAAPAARRSPSGKSPGKSPVSDLPGRRPRQLLRHVEHTAAVHLFLAALTAQARLLGWEIAQLDPPRRASRHFRHEDRMRAVNPDAFGLMRRGETRWPFFLEWERRAVRPSTMATRLAPYSSLLLISQAHRRSRHMTLRPGRPRRRDRPDPLPARCEGGDRPDEGQRPLMGVSQGGH